MNRLWPLAADFIRRRHGWLLAGAGVATAVLALGAARLGFSTGQDTIVSASTKVYQDNLRYQRQFGGDPMLVLFEGDIRQLFVPPNVDELAALERELNETGLYHAVLGPVTIAKFAQDQISVAGQLAPAALARQQEAAAAEARRQAAAAGASEAEQEQAAQEARDRLAQEFAERTAADAARLAAVGALSLDNPKFIEFLLFDQSGRVRPEVQGAFPDDQHALLVVRLNGNLTIDEQGKAAARAAQLVRARHFEGVDVLPSGSPILLKEINDKMQESMTTMGLVAVGLMVVVLSLVFRGRWRLLSLGVVLVGCLWAFGLIGYLGIPLTMVTISGLPILIGLGVDFAIQVHYRFEEESQRASDASRGLSEALSNVGPALSIAVMVATIGFVVLYISRVPMIRDFASMLSIGTVVLLIVGLVFLNSLLFLRDRRRREWAPAGSPLARLPDAGRLVEALARATMGRLPLVLAVGLGAAIAGLALDPRLGLETDPERFVPPDSKVLAELYHIRDVAGSSSELGLMVEAEDVTAPEVTAWMDDFERRQIEQHPEELLHSSSIASIVTSMTNAPPTREEVDAVLAVAPEAITRSFISDDRTLAHIIFAIGPISLAEREALVEEMEADLRAPPSVTVTPSGLAVIGIEAVHALTANRPLMTYTALGGVFVGLLLLFRHLAKAAATLLPIFIAVGASSMLLYLLGIDLNPLTSVSGPLIVAMGTEFSVLLMSRYCEERARGFGPREAVLTASRRIGAAITASGLTVIGGFGVLAFSGFPLLDTFGKVTALNISVALVSTLIVLPPVLVWTDERFHIARGAPTERAPSSS